VRVVKIALVVALLIAFALLVRALPIAEWLDAFKTWVRGVGPVGYVLYVLVYIACCILIVPALALTLGAGAIFGFAGGAVVNLIGATLGATAAFLLARGSLRHRVERMTSGSAKFAALDRAITREGTKIMWLVRVSGFPPFTWVNYAFGLTGVHLRPFLMTTFFGIIPGTIAFSKIVGLDVMPRRSSSSIICCSLPVEISLRSVWSYQTLCPTLGSCARGLVIGVGLRVR